MKGAAKPTKMSESAATFPPQINIGPDVTINYVYSHKIVFIRPSSGILLQNFQEIQREIEAFSESAQRIHDVPQQGQIALVLYRGRFYRAIILHTYIGAAVVALLDVGEVVQVPDLSIFNLSTELQDRPVYVRKVELNCGEKNVRGQLKYLQKLAGTNTELVLKFAPPLGRGTQGAEGYLIVKATGESVNANLMRLGCLADDLNNNDETEMYAAEAEHQEAVMVMVEVTNLCVLT